MAKLRTLSDRPSHEREMIPRGLLWAMLGLALSALGIASYSTLTDRPHVGVPAQAEVLREKEFILTGLSAQAVQVMDTNGKLLLDLPHGGFVTVIQSAMARARVVAKTTGNPPMKVQELANGRLVALDPATGWSAELYAFGADNEAAFRNLLDME